MDLRTGELSQAWFRFFLALWERTGGAIGVLGAPGGVNGNVQYNANGAFGGLTNAQLTALINVFSGTLSGAVPPSGGGTTKFLRADANFALIDLAADITGRLPFANFATLAASSLFGNPAVSAGSGGNVAVGAGLTLTVGGTLSATGGGGSVTQVDTTGPGITGGPITTTGTLAVEWNGGTVTALGLGVGLNSGTLIADQQTVIAATAGATIALAPSGPLNNYMINGPTAGGTVTLTGAFTPAQKIMVNVSNGATATNFILGAGFQFSTDLPSYTSTAVANKRDTIAVICNIGTVGDVEAINQGFSP